MSIIPFVIASSIALAVLFGIVYISYLPVACKQCTQREILKTSAKLTCAGLFLALLGAPLTEILPKWSIQVLTNVAFIILQYRMGVHSLSLSRKRAVLAVCISIALFILLTVGMIAALQGSGFGR